MSINKLEFLNTYDSSDNRIYIEKVNSDNLKKYYYFIKKVNKVIWELNDEELEYNFKRYKYLFNDLILSLDNYNNIFNDLEEINLEEIKNFFKEINQYIDINEVKKAFELLKNIKNGDVKNELSSKLLDIISTATTENIAIICSKNISKFKDEHSNVLNKNKISFYTQNQLLKEHKIFEILIFIGPPYLYRKFENIFQGKIIYYIMYDFFEINKLKNTIIKSNKSINSNLYENVNYIKNYKISNSSDYYIDLKEEANRKVNDILMKHSYQVVENNEKYAEGNVIRFVNDKYFLLSKNSTIRSIKLKIDSKSDNELTIEKVKLKNLKKGDWILIKSESDERLIINEAKKIIGENRYLHYLSNVKLYKNVLLEKSKDYKGLEELKSDLNSHGINLKDINTLKTWLTLETIKPKSLMEILKFLNFSDISKRKIYNSAKEINKTHIIAGKLMLKKLNEDIKNINYEKFIDNMAEFKEYILEVEDKGSFFIEEIDEISNQSKMFLKKDMNRLL